MIKEMEELKKLIEEYARLMYAEGTLDGYNGSVAYDPSEDSDVAKKALYDFIEKMEITDQEGHNGKKQ